MTVVRIIKAQNCHHKNLMQQTPTASNTWEDIKFTQALAEKCDYAIILNRVPKNIVIDCPPENIWAIIQEPPVPEHFWLRKDFISFARVYTPDTTLSAAKYIHTHGAIPWLVDKNYNFLKNTAIPDKVRRLSWITSNQIFFEGHKHRMTFLSRIRDSLEFDLWGRGFTPIADKWDGLAPYKYSLAIENYSGLYYWSEKIADCFLSYTMPIYYGCTNISHYFPRESFIWIDINKPEEAMAIIKDAIASDLWLRNRDALIYARELVLDKYQLFPFVSQLIQEARENNILSSSKSSKIVYLKKLECSSLPFILFRLLIVIARKILPAKIWDLLWKKNMQKLYSFILEFLFAKYI